MQELKQEELSVAVIDLQKRVQQLEAAAFANSPSKALKLQRISELSEDNQQVTISILKTVFKVRSSNYVRDLMQEAAKAYDLHFFKGQPGQESFVTKVKIQDKAMHAYAEVYRDLQGKPIGSTMTESAIAHRYELNGQELQSVISKLAQHREFYIIHAIGRAGIRRIKRVK